MHPKRWRLAVIRGCLCIAIFLVCERNALAIQTVTPGPFTPVNQPTLQLTATTESDFCDTDFAAADKAELGAVHGGLTVILVVLIVLGAVLLLYVMIVLPMILSLNGNY